MGTLSFVISFAKFIIHQSVLYVVFLQKSCKVALKIQKIQEELEITNEEIFKGKYVVSGDTKKVNITEIRGEGEISEMKKVRTIKVGMFPGTYDNIGRSSLYYVEQTEEKYVSFEGYRGKQKRIPKENVYPQN